MTVCCVTVKLKTATRDGELEIVILTNLPKNDADAMTVASLYRKRWTVETMFQEMTDKRNGRRIDGDATDWSIVPESYAIGQDQLREKLIGIGDKQDPINLDVKVKVGWVKGQNHLYFLYEANDNYRDFAREDLHNDIFEVVIDGDLSGGPLIRQMHRPILRGPFRRS